MELDEGGPPIVHPGPVQRPHKYTGAQQVSDTWLCPTLAYSCSSGSMNLASSSQKGPRQQHLHHGMNPTELSRSADRGTGRQKSNCCLFSLASSFPSLPSPPLLFYPLSLPLLRPCLLGQRYGQEEKVICFSLRSMHLKYSSSNYPWIRLSEKRDFTILGTEVTHCSPRWMRLVRPSNTSFHALN